MKKKKEKMVCKSTVRDEYGWTDSMIKAFMSEPDKEVPNPHYKCASEMKLYSVKRIKRIERSAKFKDAFQKVLKRREMAKNGKF